MNLGFYYKNPIGATYSEAGVIGSSLPRVGIKHFPLREPLFRYAIL